MRELCIIHRSKREKRNGDIQKRTPCRLDCVYLWVSGWVRVCGMNPYTYQTTKKRRNIFQYSNICPRILAPYYSSYLKTGLLKKDYPCILNLMTLSSWFMSSHHATLDK